MKSASYWIEHLELIPHPEGGYYKETYKSEGLLPKGNDDTFPSERSFSTGIYFLLGPNDYSTFHRIKSDEMWHFYEGGPLEVYYFQNGLQRIVLGREIDKGQKLQAVVPANTWFASRPLTKDYCLVGCTVAPGFDFRDFEMADAKSLHKQFPGNERIISELTR